MNIQEIQEMNRTILDEIVRVCNKYGIIYYLDSGALLGAVRHGSFIPWDDDVDLSFSREEYWKFKNAVKKEWVSGEYLLQEPADFHGAMWIDWINRVIHTTEEWEERHFEEKGYVNTEYAKLLACKPHIDIFVIDNLPEKKRKRTVLYVKLILDYGLAMGHRPRLHYSDYKGIEKIIIWALANIGKRMPLEKIIARYNNHCSMYRHEDTKSIYFSNYSFKYCFKAFQKEWFGDGSKVMLDGVLYNAPNNPHEYLKMVYGDYMKLPPEDQRVPKHYE